MRIVGWSAGLDGCHHYRLLLPLSEMARHGHTVWLEQVMPTKAHRRHEMAAAVKNLMRNPYGSLHAGGPDGGSIRLPTQAEADVLIGQRVCNPRPTEAWQALASSPNRPMLVFEVDDDLFETDSSSPVAHEFFSAPQIQANLRRNIQVADLVTVSTPRLAEVVSRINPRVVVLENCVSRDVWLRGAERLRSWPERMEAWTPGEPMTVGWSGSPTHEMDLRFVSRALGRPLRKIGARVHCVGPDYRRLLGVADPAYEARHTSWIPNLSAYYDTIGSFDVALAPLKPHLFNRSKCLDAGTRIATDRGVLELREVQPGDLVWRDGWRKVQAVERQPQKLGVRITTTNGYQLTLTCEHRLMVNGDWVHASDISVGDVMAMTPEAVGPRQIQVAPWPPNTTFGKDFDPFTYLTSEDVPTVRLTPRWARLLGAFIGDGNVGQSTSIQISCDGQDQDWIDLLMDDIRNLGLAPRTESIRTFNGEVLRRRSVRTSSAHLLRFLHQLGLTRQRPNGRPLRVTKVPEIIWRSPKPVIAEFLAAYFEADACCSKQGVDLSTKDEQLARDVQRLLLLFGITSRVHTKKGTAQNGFVGHYWHVTLRRAEADVFAKEIGFKSARKIARLQEITSRPHSNRYQPMAWADTVASIEEVPVEPIDIQVEGEVFAAAGFVSHNSWLRPLELAALGVPVVASRYGEYERFVTHDVTGLLAGRDHEWGAALGRLQISMGLRMELARAAHERAAGWLIEDRWQHWVAAYEKARTVGVA